MSTSQHTLVLEALKHCLNSQVEARIALYKVRDFIVPGRSETIESAILRLDEAEELARAAIARATSDPVPA